MSIIEVKNVTTTYNGHVAIKNVSFSIDKGEYVCLLDKEGVIGAKIDVTADSITAIILDVFKNL